MIRRVLFDTGCTVATSCHVLLTRRWRWILDDTGANAVRGPLFAPPHPLPTSVPWRFSHRGDSNWKPPWRTGPLTANCICTRVGKIKYYPVNQIKRILRPQQKSGWENINNMFGFLVLTNGFDEPHGDFCTYRQQKKGWWTLISINCLSRAETCWCCAALWIRKWFQGFALVTQHFELLFSFS